MKGQINLEFILSASLFIIVLIFSLITINNALPPIHKESTYSTLRARGYMISQSLICDSGIWRGLSIQNATRMGLTDGYPYIINLGKASILDNCSRSDYDKLRGMFGLSSYENFVINISLVNFSVGSDIVVATCKSPSFSSTYPKFWSTRYAAVSGQTKSIAEVDVSVY